MFVSCHSLSSSLFCSQCFAVFFSIPLFAYRLCESERKKSSCGRFSLTFSFSGCVCVWHLCTSFAPFCVFYHHYHQFSLTVVHFLLSLSLFHTSYYINYLTKAMQLEDPRIRYRQLQNEHASTESIPFQTSSQVTISVYFMPTGEKVFYFCDCDDAFVKKMITCSVKQHQMI